MEARSIYRKLWSLALVASLLWGSTLSVGAQSVDRDELQQWEQDDKAGTCDEIGWDASGIVSGSPDEEDLMHHASCLGSVIYFVFCGTVEGDGMFFEPSAGDNWIACMIMAGNAGSDEVTVSPFDFSIVDASGRKYDQDFTAQASLDPGVMFPTETLRNDQNVTGVIAFAVPRTAKLPYVLEIDPMLNFSLRPSDPGAVVITTLHSMESILQ